MTHLFAFADRLKESFARRFGLKVDDIEIVKDSKRVDISTVNQEKWLVLFIYLIIYLFVYLFDYIFICLFIYVFIIYLFIIVYLLFIVYYLLFIVFVCFLYE